MTSDIHSSPNSDSPEQSDSPKQSDSLKQSDSPKQTISQKPSYPVAIGSGVAILMLLILGQLFSGPGRSPIDPVWPETLAPLVKQGGDPYIRALMRTISAAESNSTRPYSLLYGGEHFQDLNRHPDHCVTIMAGPNQGNCSTAAGRYQFITTTWLEQARRYHPHPTGFWHKEYSFAPEYQDKVVYDWLSDPTAWNADLAALLRQDRLAEVLEILSPTWTSLGYGIEPNSMTDLLPEIYAQLLAEELQAQ